MTGLLFQPGVELTGWMNNDSTKQNIMLEATHLVSGKWKLARRKFRQIDRELQFGNRDLMHAAVRDRQRVEQIATRQQQACRSSRREMNLLPTSDVIRRI